MKQLFYVLTVVRYQWQTLDQSVCVSIEQSSVSNQATLFVESAILT